MVTLMHDDHDDHDHDHDHVIHGDGCFTRDNGDDDVVGVVDDDVNNDDADADADADDDVDDGHSLAGFALGLVPIDVC